MEFILQMRGVSKAYPGVQALDDVHLDVRRGEVLGLIGENGAGKSTLIKVLSGAVTPDSGIIMFDGAAHASFDPRTAMERGIGVIYQELNLVPYMSVADNIFLGAEEAGWFYYSPRRINAKATKILDSLGIDLAPDKLVGELSIAYQQMVEIAKAVSKNVKLLVMDEPTAPLSSSETRHLFRLIERLKSEHISIIYISHRMEEIFQLTERVTVLRDGRYVGTYESAAIDRPQLIRAMVGRELVETYPEGHHATKENVLEVKGLSGNAFRDVTFSLKKGEILGIGGLVGAGRTEIARAIFGADRTTSGEIRVDGQVASIHSPKDAVAKGISLIPEDRKGQGLHLGMSVMENISLASLRARGRLGVISKRRESASADRQIANLRIKTPTRNQVAGTLSGGNQQKVVLGKWLETAPRILIMDEPTRGIDVGAKQEIYELMRALTERGFSILMISSDMPELLGVSDRILVMRRGHVSGELTRMEATQERVLDLAAN